jgi:uncharacterized protein YtpQ (UPF0354 family)
MGDNGDISDFALIHLVSLSGIIKTPRIQGENFYFIVKQTVLSFIEPESID